MTGKYKIVISLSLALAIFYSLPWVALREQPRIQETSIQNVAGGARVAYLFVTVFLTGLLFFQYNFFWKKALLTMGSAFVRNLLNLFFNMLLVIVTCGVLIVISDKVFILNAERLFFIFYLFRNTGIALIVMLVTYVIELVEKSRQDKIEILTLQNQNSETELAALKAQIDPHFLFNSLTSLSGLIRSNSKEALTFVDHLSETFRYTLEKREHRLVTVKDELHFLESYVFMIKRRFAEGFQIVTKIEESHLAKNIPQFALQITVENAIKHNLVSVKNPLTVEIFSAANTLLVRNNLQKKKTLPGYGIGLANLSKRYQIMSTRDVTITKDDRYFVIELPLL